MIEVTCSDTQCEVREHCLHWQHRDAQGPDLHHATTLRPAWQCHSDPCECAHMTPEFYEMANLPSLTRCGPTDQFPHACGNWTAPDQCAEHLTPDDPLCLRCQVLRDQALYEEMRGWPEGLDDTRSCQ